MKVALVFAGQGTQQPKMGLNFLSKEILDQATSILGFDVESILNDEAGLIHQTKYTQPIVHLLTIVLFDLYQKKYPFDGVLGFSLGEYAALYAAGIYPFEESLKLVNQRGLYMHEASLKNKGSMAAVLNLDWDIINDYCQQNNLVIANYNALNQVVISGPTDLINQAVKDLTQLGAKRVLMLQVSGAFHSPLMLDAANKLELYLNKLTPNHANIPVYMNVTGQKLADKDLNSLLKRQVFEGVRFHQSIVEMIKDGYTHFIEIGPGQVLSNLIKRSFPEAMVKYVSEPNDLESIKEWFHE